jgi:hypothetical protein
VGGAEGSLARRGMHTAFFQAGSMLIARLRRFPLGAKARIVRRGVVEPQGRKSL